MLTKRQMDGGCTLSDLELIKGNWGNNSHIKIFLIVCIQFVLCMNCEFMK